MSMVTYGDLRVESVSPQVDSKSYSFYPDKCSEKVNMTLRQRMLPDEIFFGKYENDENNIAVSVLRALLHCDIDTRKGLIGKIVVCGGCSMISGFIERLEEEVLELLDHPDFAKLACLKSHVHVVDSHFPRNLLNWVGGSIISTLPGIEKYSTTAAQYKEKGLPDRFGEAYLLGTLDTNKN